MPYYSDLGLPSSSAYSSLFLPGPYSNHSSIIASNFSHPTTISRQYRAGYKPHLSTISELRRINSPKLLYHSTPKVIRPIKRIDTADIDVSVNKYRKYERYEKPKNDNIEKKAPEKTPSPKRSPRNSFEDKEQSEAKPNPIIRRDRPTIRLHTVHKDTLRDEIGAIRSWRDNFKPEELGEKFEEPSTAKRMKKTPGEILKEKFLIRSRSKENMLKQETKRLSRKKSVRKSPSFHDICEAITSENIDVELNPGQPEAVQWKQSRQIPCQKILKEMRRNSTNLSEEDFQILDAIISEQDNLNNALQVETNDKEVFDSRSSVRKKRLTKKKSNDNLILDEHSSQSPSCLNKSQSGEKINGIGTTPSLERRSTKKRLRTPIDNTIHERERKTDPLTKEIYKNVIRDISQVEIEQTVFKPKKVITGSGEIEETKPSLKAVVNDIEVREAPVPNKEKKFRFNVIVEVEDEETSKNEPEVHKTIQKMPKISADKCKLTSDNNGKVKFPKGEPPVISSILKKKHLSYSGHTVQEKEKTVKRPKLLDSTNSISRTNSVNESSIEVEEINDTVKMEDIQKDTLSLSTNSRENEDTRLDGGKQPLHIENNSKTDLTTDSEAGVEIEKTEIKAKLKHVGLPRGLCSLNSKERSPAPASSTITEINIFNKILSKKETTPDSSVIDKNSPSFDTTTTNGINSFSEKIKSPPPSPLTKIPGSGIKFDSPPISPIIKKQQNFFNKGTTAPLSPVAKQENVFNRLSPKIDNIENNTTNKEFTTVEENSKNILNKLPSQSNDKESTSVQENSKNILNKQPSQSNDKEFIVVQENSKNILNTQPSQSNDKAFTALRENAKNILNKKSSQSNDSNVVTSVPIKEVIKKEDTITTSPTVTNQSFFNKQHCETANDIIKSVRESNMVPQKDENDNTINVCDTSNELSKSESTKSIIEKKLVSKRSLVQKANKDDPDLIIFIPPEPEPEPEPVEEKKDVFVPLQSNRLSQWMHPWKKPEQFDVCPVELYARPKVIRGRHYPRPRGQPAPPSSKSEESSSEEEEEETDEETEEETSSEEEDTSEEESEEESASNSKIGASTSSNDSGFGSGAVSSNKDCDVNIHKKCEKLTANLCGVNQKLVVEAIESVRKGSLESRDSPTSNHANNPAFALDSGDIPEEYSQSSTFTGFQKSGRITPPATTIPRFRKYCVDDFNFLKVLGKGSFGKVLLAELKGTEYYYAIKCLKKDVVLEDDDVECTLIERKVLALGTKHPYLCHLLCTFQTESHLFFVMEYLNGGDLMFHIQASGRFPEHQARFYGAEIVSGLKFLHNKGIVYRDLKLDNILLDFDGHVRIADFGMCKLQIFLDRMAETFCGTPDYMAPEIIKGQHYNQNVDWWSFGVLLYEMLLGQSPFSGCDEDELFWSICNEKPVLPRFLSAEATNILTLFLEKDASKRLGNRFSPHGDIQDQPFFKSIDWYALEARKLEPPFKPNLQHPLDTQYFDKHFTVEKAKLTPIDTTILQSMDQTQFQGFSYTNPNATDK